MCSNSEKMVDIGVCSIPTWSIVSLVTVYLGYRYLTRGFDLHKRRGIPGPKPYPIIGTLYIMMKKGLGQGQIELRQKYGKVVGLYQGSTPVLDVGDLDIMKEILIKDFNSFPNRMDLGFRDYISRKMVTAITSEHWRHVRKMLSTAFSGGKLRRMEGTMNNCCRTLVYHLREKAGNEESVDIKRQCSFFTMDAISSTAFGLDIDSKNNPHNDLVKHAESIFKTFSGSKGFSFKTFLLLINGRLMKKSGMKLFPTETLDFFSQMVNKAMEFRNIDESKKKDFLQMLVDLDVGEPTEDDMTKDADLRKSTQGYIYSLKGLTTEEILGTSFIFFLAGYDTTATGFAFLLYNLAVHHEVQEKVHKDITAALGDKDEPDYDTLKQMPYLQMCLEESLRLYPPAPRLNRTCDHDVIINGIRIDKGTGITIPVYAIHMDPEIWPEPDKFIPERFTAEAKAHRHPMAWLPFGQGPRMCLAMRLALMEIKFAIVHVIREFKVKPCKETPIPMKLEKVRMAPVGGMKLMFEKR